MIYLVLRKKIDFKIDYCAYNKVKYYKSKKLIFRIVVKIEYIKYIFRSE